MTTTSNRPAGGSRADPTTIIEVSHVTKTFVSPDGSPLPVLDDISLDLREGEIVALLGPLRLGQEHAPALHCRADRPDLGRGQATGAQPSTAPTPEWRWCSRASPCCRG